MEGEHLDEETIPASEELQAEATTQDPAGQDTIDLRGANVRIMDGAEMDKRVQQAVAQISTTLQVNQDISAGAQTVLTKVIAQIDLELSKPEKTRIVDLNGTDVEVPVSDHERIRNLAEAARYLSDVHEFAQARARVARVLTRPILPGKKGKKHGKR